MERSGSDGKSYRRVGVCVWLILGADAENTVLRVQTVTHFGDRLVNILHLCPVLFLFLSLFCPLF